MPAHNPLALAFLHLELIESQVLQGKKKEAVKNIKELKEIIQEALCVERHKMKDSENEM